MTDRAITGATGYHVRDVPGLVPVYDWLFLGVAGVPFTLIGWMLSRRAHDHLRPGGAGVAR